MEIEKTTGALRNLASTLSDLARAMDGTGPELSGGWYKVTHRSPSGYAWFRVIGERARIYPANSVHLVVYPHPTFREDERLGTGNDWWGKEDRHVVATTDSPRSIALAFETIARAFSLDDSTP